MKSILNKCLKLTLLSFCLIVATDGYSKEQCTIPSEIPKPVLETPKPEEINKIKPDYYALSISWSPFHCSDPKIKENPNHSFQCSLNKFSFVVHGLWGQNSKAVGKNGQPRNCSRSLVSDQIIKETLCIVPGVKLIQDQWQKHGSCTGMNESQYFTKTRELWSNLNKPDINQLLDKDNRVKVSEIIDAFASVNKDISLPKEAIAVQVGSRNRFKEVFICYDLNFKFTECKTGKTPLEQVITVDK